MTAPVDGARLNLALTALDNQITNFYSPLTNGVSASAQSNKDWYLSRSAG